MDKLSKPDMNSDRAFDARIAENVKAQRLKNQMTLEALALKSSISRAMISKIERGEVSPTAVLLARLTNALGITLSQIFSLDANQGPLVRAGDRPVWSDPATGYTRRNVAPQTSPADIVDVSLPAGAHVNHDNAVPLNLTQIIWVLEGQLVMMIDGTDYELGPGDSIQMKLDRPIGFRNQSAHLTRYAVVLIRS